jgi:tetratricopeptide (TPR) repeat protein
MYISRYAAQALFGLSMRSRIESARALHSRGELEAADVLYREITSAHPDSAEAHYRYGNLLKDQGLLQAALVSYDRAVALKPDYAHAFCNRAVVLGLLDRLPDALASYDRALAIDPTDVVAYCNRGALLNALDRKEEALASFEAAIAQDAGSFAAHFGRAALLQERQDWAASLRAYDRAIGIRPDDAPAHFNRGTVLKQLQQWPAALASYETVLALNPAMVPAHAACGDVFEQLGRLDLALERYDRALSLRPEDATLHNNRAVLQQKMGKIAEALTGYERAIALNPRYAEAHYNRGTALEVQGDLEGALNSYDLAIGARPRYAEAHLNRGSTLQASGRPHEAVVAYRQALEINPEFAEAHYNLALASLQVGDFATGWRAYEWRWRAKGGSIFRERRNFSEPLWTGNEPITGRTILLYGEQGLGDSLQFCRYAREVAQLGAHVILELPPPLVDLCSALAGVQRVLPFGSPLPEFDYQCPLMSLPLAFSTTLETIPSPMGYLSSDASRVAAWRARLGAKSKPRVGLAWSGRQTGGTYRRRHFPLASLIPHLSKDFRYFCLQTEVTAADQDTLAQNPWIGYFAHEILDFRENAALCDCMDLVITVDTSVAHLAGALGKKTWVLLAFSADWRWLTGREDSPWYHGARLFRQESPGQWMPVFERVARELPIGVAD